MSVELPQDILYYLFDFFDAETLSRASQVNRFWNQTSTNIPAWKKHFRRFFPREFDEIIAREEDRTPDFSWADRFMTTLKVAYPSYGSFEDRKKFYMAINNHDLPTFMAIVSKHGFSSDAMSYLLFGSIDFWVKPLQLITLNGFEEAANMLWQLALMNFANEDKSILWVWGIQLRRPLEEIIPFSQENDWNSFYTFLMAMDNYHFEIAEYMRVLGFDLNSIIPDRGQSMLWHACTTKNFPAVKFLCERGVNINLPTRSCRLNNTQMTVALEAACGANSFACVRYLLEKGSTVSVLSLEAKATLFEMLLTYPYFVVRNLKEKNGGCDVAHCLLEILKEGPSEVNLLSLAEYKKSLAEESFVTRLSDVFTIEVWKHYLLLQSEKVHVQPQLLPPVEPSEALSDDSRKGPSTGCTIC